MPSLPDYEKATIMQPGKQSPEVRQQIEACPYHRYVLGLLGTNWQPFSELKTIWGGPFMYAGERDPIIFSGKIDISYFDDLVCAGLAECRLVPLYNEAGYYMGQIHEYRRMPRNNEAQ